MIIRKMRHIPSKFQSPGRENAIHKYIISPQEQEVIRIDTITDTNFPELTKRSTWSV